MMNRELLVYQDALEDDAGTYEYTLPKAGYLSALDIIFQATNGATSNRGSPIFECITKIEVVGDGDNVLFSLTGKELIAQNWLTYGKRMPELISEAPSVVQFNTFRIDFGRKLGDKEFALNLRKFNEVKLKITYNLEAVNSTGDTGFVSGSGKVTLIAWKWPESEAPPVKGIIKRREIKNFTTASSGDEIVKLPMMYKIRNIYVYCREAGVDDGTDITKIVLRLNGGERVPFVAYFDELQKQNAFDFNVDPTVRGVAYASNDDTWYVYTGRVKNIVILDSTTPDATNDTFIVDKIDSISGDQVTLASAQADITAGSEDLTDYTTDHTIYWEAEGYGVANTVVVKNYVNDDPSEYLDTKKYSEVELILTQGGSGGDARIFIEEVVPM